MSDIFVRELSKVVVAQLCKPIFQGIQQSSCEVLSDILQKYVEEIGKRSHSYAELSGRTDCNFHDVRQSLKDLGVYIEDLYTFATVAEEVPFALNVPEFPLKSESYKPEYTSSLSGTSTEVSKNNNQPEKPTTIVSHPPYVSDFLPPFPEPHTYMDTPIFPERVGNKNARQFRKKKTKEKRWIENSVANLNEKLGSKPITNYDQVRKIKSNPYFSTPEESIETRNLCSNKEEPTALSINPTPLPKDSPFVKNVVHNKPNTEDELTTDQNKKNHSDLDESEKLRKRQRAEELLSMKIDGGIVDT